MKPCIPKRKDITHGGGKYNRECVYFCGFAEVADSLLAIKTLCFSENPVCSLGEPLSQCRCNWKYEVLRQRAISAPSYGDSSEELSRLAGRLYDDLYRISQGLSTAYGGEFRIGFNQYTEIIWWGKLTKATPNGRRHGDFLSQGISPSRLVREASALDILDSMRYMDMKNAQETHRLQLLFLPESLTRVGLFHFSELSVQAVYNRFGRTL